MTNEPIRRRSSRLDPDLPDVLAAQVVGMTGVLVRTGKFRQDTLDRWAADEFAMQPNHVIDSVADLPEVLGV